MASCALVLVVQFPVFEKKPIKIHFKNRSMAALT